MMHVKPQIGTYEAQLRAEHISRRLRLMGKAKPPASAIPFNPPAPPLWKEHTLRFDEHVTAFRNHVMKSFVEGYVKVRSLELGVCAKDILSTSRFRIHSHARHVMIYEIWHRFGKGSNATGMSLPRIARIFGKDHTTIMNSIRRGEEILRGPH